MRAELASDALRMALANRRSRASGVIFHSDRGTQYGARDFMDLAEQTGLRQSMGRVDDCFDCALVESFIATLKGELLYTRSWLTLGETRSALVHWIQPVYKRRRRCSSIGMPPPPPMRSDISVQCHAAKQRCPSARGKSCDSLPHLLPLAS